MVSFFWWDMCQTKIDIHWWFVLTINSRWFWLEPIVFCYDDEEIVIDLLIAIFASRNSE